MKAIQKIVVLTILIISLFSYVSASDLDTVRQAGIEYAKAGEGVMVEGPFYLNGNPYWIVDYLKRGEVQASLVYDYKVQQFVTDRTVMKKVFATREFKNITMVDPLFYAVGDPSVIPVGAKYETQNVRNFATFSQLDAEERDVLDTFLKDYERTAQKIADSIQLTNSLLRPGVNIKVNYEEYPLKLLIETQNTTDHFSYEGGQQLLNAYEDVYSEYSKLLLGIDTFTGTLEDIPPGTIIRQKRGIKITRESLLGEIELVNRNGQEIKEEIDLRRSILNGDYSDQIKSTEKRLPRRDQREGLLNLKIGVILAALIALLILRNLRKRPGTMFTIFLMSMILLNFTTPVLTQEGDPAYLKIPSAEELLSQKVINASQVRIQIFAEGISNEIARGIVEGYPLILEGEEVYVRGPYYEGGQSYYLFDIVDNDVPTGNLIVVDVSTLHMVGGYSTVTRLVKTSFLTDMVRQKPLYQAVDADILESEALRTGESSMAIFLTRLSENVREGKELEERLVETPDFETARDLARHYKRGFIFLQRMEQLASPADVEDLTHGFAREAVSLEAYSLVVKYTITDDWLKVSQARYRGRSLNRIPMMQVLAAAGMTPSKLQVVHDLTTDLIYGNTFLWRLGKIDPPFFASLPRKVGEISTPGEE